MKYSLNKFSILYMILFITSCKQAQTLSPRKVFYLSIEKSDFSEKLDVSVNAGKAKEIETNGKNTLFEIILFQVKGGYSELFGSKFNNHDGLETKRISIYLNEGFARSLSYMEIENLKGVEIDTIYAHIIKL